MVADRTGTVDRDRDFDDMQALIVSGFGLLHGSDYLLLDVADTGLALAWLDEVRPCVHSVKSLGLPKEPGGAEFPDEATFGQPQPHRHPHALSIAFTWRGLVRLGVVENEDAPFPSDFRCGQSAPVRRKLLRDDPDETWSWGDAPDDSASGGEAAVSLLVARFHDGSNPDAHCNLDRAYLETRGLIEVGRLRGCADSFRTGPDRDGKTVTRLYEPFGFRDGVAQPVLKGLRTQDESNAVSKALVADSGDAQIPLGEVVLGHVNGFGEPAHSPEVMGSTQGDAFGRNGCYLAVRQIDQDVQAFEAFEKAHPAAEGEPSLTEKMIGRQKNGCPLQTVPDRPASEDAFRFRMNDSQGFQCPVGAHIRRANPRDSLAGSVEEGVSSSKLHRLLRRGRPYEGADGRPAGLIFVAMVADLARQFEFVKRIWIGNPSFGDLASETDPLLGGAAGRHVMIPGVPLGTRMPGLAGFTRVKGGGYFFLPGLAALEQLAKGHLRAGPGVAVDRRSTRATP